MKQVNCWIFPTFASKINNKTMKRLFSLLWINIYATFVFANAQSRHFTVADGLPNNQVRQIIELPNRQILVAAEGAFCLFNGKRFVTLACNLDSLQPLPSFGGEDCLWQGDSLLWLKDYYSLYLFDTRTRRFRYDYDAHTPTPALQRFIDEPSDSLAQRKHDNLYQHAPLMDSLRHLCDLQEDFIMAYCRDHHGGQWFGLQSSGIIYQPPATADVSVIAIEGDTPRRMVALDQRTMLVAGNWGVYLFDTVTRQVTRTLLRGNLFTAEMMADHHGQVWISTNQGLFCYSRGEIEHFQKDNVQGFVHDFVRFALPVDEQRVLVCNYMHNLGYLYPREHRWQSLNSELPALDSYRTMIVAEPLTNRNQVAVCTQNGFFILDTRADTLMLHPLIQEAAHFNRKYNCILLDRTGRLWIGTQNGLLLLTESGLRRITQSDGLSNQCIKALAEDQGGNIWVSTASGVNRIRVCGDELRLRIRSVTSEHGLPTIEMLERGICMMPDGYLYLGSAAGLVVVPTAEFEASPTAPSLELVGLDVAGVEMPLDTLPCHLRYRQNYIELQVSALEYAFARSLRYRYRIVQLEDGWHSTRDGDGGLAVLRLSALPSGEYTIEVQGSMGDDLWGKSLRKTFIIHPPLWLTWWAKLLYVLVGTLAVSGIIREYLRRKREKMRRENERRVNELFELREEARRQFAQAVDIDPVRLTRNMEEERLVERILKAIEKNMTNTSYTVDQLAQDIGMSRAVLYKKMQASLGITPNDFVRNVRLKRAAELLARSDVPVNQLALMVGFQTPRYFSQCFRRMFGVTPSEYREGKAAAEEPTAHPS